MPTSGLLLAGWLFGMLWPLRLGPWALALLGMLLVLGGLGARGSRPVRLLCWIAAAWALSGAWTQARLPVEGPTDLSRLAPRRWVVLVGRVASDPLPTSNGWRFELQVRELAAPWHQAAHGRLMARYQGHERPCYGTLVRMEGSLNRPSPAMNPGEFSYQDFLARQGIFSTLAAHRLQVLEPAPWSLQGSAIALKDRCMGELARQLPASQASLLGSLLLGSGASPIDPETSDAFRTLGLGHLLAVSGAQILLIVGALKGLCESFGLSRRLAVPLCFGAIAFYGLMTGLPPSVVRAIVMASLSLVVWGAQRRSRRWLPLLLATWGMLVYRPAWLFDMGFQFSVLATFALQHTSPLIAERLRGLGEFWSQAIATTLAAALWVTPLQLMTFGQLSAWTLVANLVAVFAIEALTLAGAGLLLISLALSPFGLSLCVHAFFKPVEWILALLTGSVEVMNRLPGASLYLAALSGAACAAMYALLLLGVWTLERGRQGRAMACFVLMAFMPLLRLPDRALELYVLSIGQGDGMVLKTPGGQWYVIDTGPAWEGGDAGTRVIVPFLRRQGVNRLAGLVLTHPHADHVGGAASIVRSMPVETVWDGGQSTRGNPLYDAFLAAMLERHVPFRVVSAGLVAELEPGLSLEVLGPPAHVWHGTHSDCNNNSVVLKLKYRESSLLLAGDLEQDAERLLARTL
ncbi:MAG TPA: DNA internalization-related competence protein ComEC/Rec2, partial [Stenomitos sp.]